MKKTIITGGLAAVSLAALIAGSAMAQAAPAPSAPRQAQTVTQAEFVQARVSRLTALDADHDGAVSAEELRAGAQARRADQASRHFYRLDADSNGQISRAEFEAVGKGRGDRAGHRGPRGADHRGHRAARHGARHWGRHGGEARHPGQGVGRGPIIIAEVQTKLSEGFARRDTNHDGVLSSDERRAGRVALRDRVRAHHADRRANRAPAATSASPSAPASE